MDQLESLRHDVRAQNAANTISFSGISNQLAGKLNMNYEKVTQKPGEPDELNARFDVIDRNFKDLDAKTTKLKKEVSVNGDNIANLEQLALQRRKLVFLHIGKAGGTSFDKMMQDEFSKDTYIGGKHFDWSWIDSKYPNEHVLALFRDPVSRAISHFYYMKTLPWTKGMTIRSLNINEFFANHTSMMENRGCWQDGQAGVSWLTGTHVGKWVTKGWINHLPPETLERQALDVEKMLTLAADRIDNMFWFGIVEDMDRSIEMLGKKIGRHPVSFMT